jgi:U3 small nucleolar RNA-associated protein 10
LSTALVRELVALAGAGIGGGADLGAEATTEAGKKVAAATLRLVDAHHPAAASAAVDAVLSENAAASASAAQRNGSAQSNGAAQSNGGKKGGKGKKEEAGGAAAFLREALSGSAAGPMPGHAASLGAALDHPQAGLREAALRELRQGGAGAKVMAGGVNGSNKKKGAAPIPGVLSGALLRRVSDDVPRVAAAAASLPGLRAAVGDDEALFSAATGGGCTAVRGEDPRG